MKLVQTYIYVCTYLLKIEVLLLFKPDLLFWRCGMIWWLHSNGTSDMETRHFCSGYIEQSHHRSPRHCACGKTHTEWMGLTLNALDRFDHHAPDNLAHEVHPLHLLDNHGSPLLIAHFPGRQLNLLKANFDAEFTLNYMDVGVGYADLTIMLLHAHNLQEIGLILALVLITVVFRQAPHKLRYKSSKEI